MAHYKAEFLLGTILRKILLRHNSWPDKLHWLHTWIRCPCSCECYRGEWTFFNCSFFLSYFDSSVISRDSLSTSLLLFWQVSDDTDVTKWRTVWIITIAILIVEVALFPNNHCSFPICLPGNSVLLACKRRTPKLEQSRKGHRAGKRLVPGKFERFPQLLKTEEEFFCQQLIFLRLPSQWGLPWWELCTLASWWASMATSPDELANLVF